MMKKFCSNSDQQQWLKMHQNLDAARRNLSGAQTQAKSSCDFLIFLFHNYSKDSIRLESIRITKSVEICYFNENVRTNFIMWWDCGWCIDLNRLQKYPTLIKKWYKISLPYEVKSVFGFLCIAVIEAAFNHSSPKMSAFSLKFKVFLVFFINISSVVFCQWPPPPPCKEISPGTHYSCPGSNSADPCTEKVITNSLFFFLLSKGYFRSEQSQKINFNFIPPASVWCVHHSGFQGWIWCITALGSRINESLLWWLPWNWHQHCTFWLENKESLQSKRSFKLKPLTAVVFIFPVKGSTNLYAIGVSSRVVKLIKWDGISPESEYIRDLFAVEQDSHYSTNFWHISSADLVGRFYGGTFRQEFCSNSADAEASYYDWTPEQGVKKLQGNAKVLGSFAISPKTNTFYLADVCRNLLRAYKWSPETGELSMTLLIHQHF